MGKNKNPGKILYTKYQIGFLNLLEVTPKTKLTGRESLKGFTLVNNLNSIKM